MDLKKVLMENLAIVSIVAVAAIATILPTGIEVKIFALIMVVTAFMMRVPGTHRMLGSATMIVTLVFVSLPASLIIALALVIATITEASLPWIRKTISAKAAKLA